MIFYEDLEHVIFQRHKEVNADELVILSGYIGPKPIENLGKLQLKTTIIYGMYASDGIGRGLHQSLLQLDAVNDNVKIYYSELPVHSKCYIWKKNNKIVTALVGSANFSINGLYNPYKEILAEVSYKDYERLNIYIDQITGYCKKCDQFKVINYKKQKKKLIIENQTINKDMFCKMSLLDNSGNVPEKSGLNWGLAKGHTTSGDAYIAIKKGLIEEFPELFPPKLGYATNIPKGGKTNRQNEAVEFIWDDGTIMEGLLEGSQNIEGRSYPKQLCSGPKKYILGKYLRKRMGIEDLDYLITKEDLMKYGRTDVSISLQGEGVYMLDFSVKKNR